METGNGIANSNQKTQFSLQNQANRTRTIQKIPAFETLTKGYRILIALGMFFFLFGGIAMIIVGITENDITDIIVGSLTICLFGTGLVMSSKGGKYIPGKSFFFWRLTKEKLRKFAIWSTIFLVIFAIAVAIIDSSITSIGSFVGGLLGIYYLLKSIKVHEDIDYAANDAILKLAGINIDEKIIASYQNFDNIISKYEKKHNIIVVTNRKIFFAAFDGTHWLKLNRSFDDIQKIGIGGKSNNDYYLKVVFFDNTSFRLQLNIYDKITTTPSLFVRQFLSALDSYLLGYEVVPNTSRRRVTVSSESGGQTVQTPAVRKIELNQTISKAIKEAEEVKPGRILEF
jgi:hypothetical protein